MKPLLISTLLAIGLLMAACTGLAPTASKISAAPARFDSTPPPVPEIATSLRTLFSDSGLNHYLSRAAVSNPDLKVAAANLEEAGFNTRQNRSPLFPTIAASTDGSRSQNNSSGQGFNAGTFDAKRFTATLDVQWELDLWGRIRSGITAATRDQQAASADYRSALQSISAQTAQAYFQLVGATQRVTLGQRRLESLAATLNLVDRRFDRGSGNYGDVNLAKTDVENSKARLAELTDLRDKVSRLLASLTGAYPDRSRTASSWPSLDRRVATGIPSSLLRNRPDIDAAYQRIRAADARVKVAHASLFPSFNLTGRYGRQSSALQDLTSPDFTVWSLAGNLTAPLFQGGALRAELGAANSRAKAALANYHSSVITALREVEDSLGSESLLAQRESATRSALAAAKKAESRVQRNYESGLSEILTLLDTQRRSFDTEEALISIRELRFLNRITLALALGKAY
ncbi:MAG: NodT family efflux transporter outer membrane factor (OMF) lipoprotein [Akkermansiaceae bacterium]|jgi:NodT family efflux transporter outer membrane factor (OMF) lipoprotein